MTERKCLYQVDGRGVATVTLNRPEKHNALDAPMVQLLHDYFEQTLRDGARVLVIRAMGASFCAGADLSWMHSSAALSRRQNRKEALDLAEMLLKLATLPLPVLSLAQGPAYGGGVGLLACSDVVLAAESAAFAFTEVRLGLVPAVIGPHVMRCIGERAARRYFLTGERIDAAEAQRMGLVSEAVFDTELALRAETIVEQLLEGGPNAQAAIKAMMTELGHRPLDRGLAKDTASLIAEVRSTQEGKEGINAFLEKRRPDWRRERENV